MDAVRREARDITVDLESGEAVRDLFIREILRAPGQHHLEKRLLELLPLKRRVVSDIETDFNSHRFAAVLLREKSELHRAGLHDFGAGIDVLLRVIKRFSLFALLIEVMRRDLLRDRNTLRHRGTPGGRLRKEHTDHTVIADKVPGNRAGHTFRRHIGELIPADEEKSPVTLPDVLGKLHAEFLGVREHAVIIRPLVLNRHLHFAFGRRLFAEGLFKRLHHGVAHLRFISGLLEKRADEDKARILSGDRETKHLFSESRVNQRLIETPLRAVSQNRDPQRHAMEVRVV
ncbi:unknown [Sutterella sp. CAG:351]|nr:unknown [Sutterella sp. CAG:351]